MNEQRESALAQLELANQSTSISFQANAVAAAHVRALLYLADVMAGRLDHKE